MATPPVPVPSAPPRPHIIERADYKPTNRLDAFIVSLLAEWVHAQLDEALAAKPGARVLDVGCGRQPFKNYIRGLGGSYVSLDVNQSPEGNVDYLAAIDGDLPADLTSQQPFDVILCTEVLEHVADWKQAFSNLARLTAPGAVAIITCPHYYPLHEEPYDFWRPTVHAIRAYAYQNGFDVVQLEKAGGAWEVLGTYLGNFRIGPATRGLHHRILARGLDTLARIMYRIIASGWVQKRCVMHATTTGPSYLSNLAVLHKRGEVLAGPSAC